MKRAPGFFLFFAVWALVFMVTLAVPVRAAATFTANKANDGSGVCATDPATNGVCTSRAAIQAAAALGGSNAIIVPAGTGNLTITGAGAQQTVIDAWPAGSRSLLGNL